VVPLPPLVPLAVAARRLSAGLIGVAEDQEYEAVVVSLANGWRISKCRCGEVDSALPESPM